MPQLIRFCGCVQEQNLAVSPHVGGPMKSLILSVLILLSSQSFASEISKQLFKEFDQMYELVSSLEPDGQVGGLLNEKVIGDYSLLWKLADEPGEYDVIRIYRDYPGERFDHFSVSYYLADHIVPGRTVLRRFVGTKLNFFRNHTVDAKTGEYLGSQGASFLSLRPRDQEILDHYGIVLFE
jgi:hypothetical protein